MNPIKHVAIIMDGNGRWGIKHKNSRNAGHSEGLNTVESVINECLKINIKYLTLYTFSTENWKRPKKEINKLIKKNIKVKFIGEINKLPIRLRKIIKNSELKTSKNSSLQVNVALNYGSKSELINSIKN